MGDLANVALHGYDPTYVMWKATSSESTTVSTFNGVDYTGEWVQIDIGDYFVLKGFQLAEANMGKGILLHKTKQDNGLNYGQQIVKI